MSDLERAALAEKFAEMAQNAQLRIDLATTRRHHHVDSRDDELDALEARGDLRACGELRAWEAAVRMLRDEDASLELARLRADSRQLADLRAAWRAFREAPGRF